jgi:hypothetical protein
MGCIMPDLADLKIAYIAYQEMAVMESNFKNLLELHFSVD